MVFGHESAASLLRELGRNPALLGLCGFDPLGRQAPTRRTVERTADGGATVVHLPSPRRDGVPTAWAFSRFVAGVAKLEDEVGAVSGMVAALRRRLMDELPGFGRHLGYDGKAVDSHSTGRAKAATGKRSDPDADWGKHETHGVDAKTGRSWTKVKTWFGYGLHLIADVEHEIPVWFEVTKASASEHSALSAGVDGLFGEEPELAARCADFCADRGLDAGPLRKKLWDVYEVRPAGGHAGDVAGGEAGAGVRPGGADPACAGGGRRRQRAAQREGRGVVPLPGDGDGAADGVPGLRGGPGHAEVPLPGGGVRSGLRGPGPVSARRRVGCRGLRAGGAHRPGGARPAHVHADAVGEPVVEARLRPARGAGADQLAPRRQLRLRAPLRARPGEDEDAPGPGGGRDDGAGAGRGPGGPPGADAFAGRPGAAARGLTAAVQPSAPNRPRRSRDPLARACGPARANGNNSYLDAANPVPSDPANPRRRHRRGAGRPSPRFQAPNPAQSRPKTLQRKCLSSVDSLQYSCFPSFGVLRWPELCTPQS